MNRPGLAPMNHRLLPLMRSFLCPSGGLTARRGAQDSRCLERNACCLGAVRCQVWGQKA